MFVLFPGAAMTACSPPEANQDITPAEIVSAVLDRLGIDPGDVGDMFYSEGGEDHVFDDMLLGIMFPPVRTAAGETVYTMEMFEQYAIVQFTKARPAIFEIGVFKVSKTAHGNGNGMLYRNVLSRIETMCKERVNRIERTAVKYSPELAFAAGRANVYIFDNYVYYAIAENFPDAYSEIRSRLTGN
jgi:hypothetical protein